MLSLIVMRWPSIRERAVPAHNQHTHPRDKKGSGRVCFTYPALCGDLLRGPWSAMKKAMRTECLAWVVVGGGVVGGE